MKISVLGCGWLGLPLAKALVAEGHAVKGSTTSKEKLAGIRSFGIDPYLILLGRQQSDLPDFFTGSDALIINIPPQARKAGTVRFPDKILELLPFVEKSTITKVLFVSSTSVYADDNAIVTEETEPQPQTESGLQLLEAETLLSQNRTFETTVLRFGGLLGPDRHPITSLAGKPLANPRSPVNLILRNDCIGIISSILSYGKWGEVYNAVYPDHPDRIVYYSRKAAEYALDPPIAAFGPSNGKLISAQKVQQFYTFTTGI